jgi:hypothetical protein
MKQLFLLALVAVSLEFLPGYRCCSEKPRSTDSLLTKLKANRENAEEYYITHGDDLISFVKAPGGDTLIEVLDTLQQKNGHKLPDQTGYSYDILKNADGRIIYIDRMSSTENPYSLRIYVHYFDKKGNTYAFQRKEAMFFDDGKPKLVIDDHTMYYNKDFKIIGETDTIKDSNHQLVSLTKEERNKMKFKYDIYRTLATCLKGYSIKLKK